MFCDLKSGVVVLEGNLFEIVWEEGDLWYSIPTTTLGNCVVVCAAVLPPSRTCLLRESRASQASEKEESVPVWSGQGW